MNLIERVKHIANGGRILFDWTGDGYVVVDQEQAQKRANACLRGDTDAEGKPRKCRFNLEGDPFTKAIAYAIKEQTELKNELQLRVDGEKSLEQCAICTCELRLKIWLPMQYLKSQETPEEARAWPPWCWMKNEQ